MAEAVNGTPQLEEDGDAPVAGRERWTLSLISLGHFFSHYYGLVLPPLFPFLKAEFGVSYIELGLAMTAYMLLGGIMQSPVGFLVDRIGPRSVLLAGLALNVFAVLFMGFVGSYWMLLFLAVLAGLGNSVFHPADYAILNGTIRESKLGRAFAIHTFSGFLGGACAPVTVLVLAQWTDWRTAVIATGVAGLIALAIMYWRRDRLEVTDTKTMLNAVIRFSLNHRLPIVAAAGVEGHPEVYEVEMKFPVADASAMEQKLVGLAARFREPVQQTDRYFVHPCRDFGRTDEALRLRRVGDEVELTWKGPRIDSAAKTRQEILLPLPTGPRTVDEWTELLAALGFRVLAEVVKRRHAARVLWQGAEVDAALDHVDGVGNYLELEILARQGEIQVATACVDSLARELSCGDAERRSYLELQLEARLG